MKKLLLIVVAAVLLIAAIIFVFFRPVAEEAGENVLQTGTGTEVSSGEERPDPEALGLVPDPNYYLELMTPYYEDVKAKVEAEILDISSQNLAKLEEYINNMKIVSETQARIEQVQYFANALDDLKEAIKVKDVDAAKVAWEKLSKLETLRSAEIEQLKKESE